MACSISFSCPGIELKPGQWKSGILTNLPPGNSPSTLQHKNKLYHAVIQWKSWNEWYRDINKSNNQNKYQTGKMLTEKNKCIYIYIINMIPCSININCFLYSLLHQNLVAWKSKMLLLFLTVSVVGCTGVAFLYCSGSESEWDHAYYHILPSSTGS